MSHLITVSFIIIKICDIAATVIVSITKMAVITIEVFVIPFILHFLSLIFLTVIIVFV